MKSIADRFVAQMHFNPLMQQAKDQHFADLNYRVWFLVSKQIYRDLYVHGRP